MTDKKKSFQVKSDSQICFKVVFLGSSSVGKTSIIKRYLNNEFAMKSMSTVGVACESKILSVRGQQIKVQLWDTAGQERFRSLTKNYYRGSDAVVIVYDICNNNSFLQADGWIQDFDEKCEKSAVKLLIGNKIDMQKREVSKIEGEAYAKKQTMQFQEVSAKENENIEQTMQLLIEQLLESRSVPQEKSKVCRRNSLTDTSLLNTSMMGKSTFSSINLWRSTMPAKQETNEHEHEFQSNIENKSQEYKITISPPRESIKLKSQLVQQQQQQQQQQIDLCMCPCS